jgi:CubicO group peptidase (beta-lactamase class C family)
VNFRTPWIVVLCLFLSAKLARADNIDDYCNAQLAKQHIPGLSIGVVDHGKLVTARAYGLADVELNVPASKDTVYEIGSMTKQFTATLVMMLAEQSEIGLDDKISKFLAHTPEAWKDITVRQLLTHTSGIHGYTEVGDFMMLARNTHTQDEIVKMVSGMPLDFVPGAQWKYSNTGYYLLGMIIEKVSGKSYDDYLSERILKPLGMNETRNGDPGTIIQRRACGYQWTGKYQNSPALQPSAAFAAGELVSTVADLAKWDAALYTESLVKSSSLQQMWTPVKLNDGKTFDYGFGWAVGNRDGHKLMNHGGGTAGFSTMIFRLPDDHLTVLVLTNCAGADCGAIADTIAGLVNPALAKKAQNPIVDKTPATTARLKALLLAVAAGTTNPDEFTPDFRKEIFPDKAKQASQVLKQLGDLKLFELVAQKDVDKLHAYQYRARFGDTTVKVAISLTDDGKIAGLGITPE